jgi:hypothetical protein
MGWGRRDVVSTVKSKGKAKREEKKGKRGKEKRNQSVRPR